MLHKNLRNIKEEYSVKYLSTLKLIITYKLSDTEVREAKIIGWEETFGGQLGESHQCLEY